MQHLDSKSQLIISKITMKQIIEKQKQGAINLPKQLNLSDFNSGNNIYVMCQKQLVKEFPLQQSCQKYLQNFLNFEGISLGVKTMKNYLVIKINQVLQNQRVANRKKIAEKLAEIHNNFDKAQISIKISNSEKQLLSKILLETKAFQLCSQQQAKLLLEDSCLVHAGIATAISEVPLFLEKAETAFILSYASLMGRINAFYPQVHHDKNHKGESLFAERIFSRAPLNESYEKQKITNVQDPYSIRCSPQVYGVAYDCHENLKIHFMKNVNRSHQNVRYIGNKKIPNLFNHNETDLMLLQYLICGLNEIGSMSFLRSERILNKYLAKQSLEGTNDFDNHWARIQQMSFVQVSNRQLSYPSSTDTINMHNFEKDIYTNKVKTLQKYQKMIINLRYLISFEIFISIKAIEQIYGPKEKQFFKDQSFEKQYRLLQAQMLKQQKNFEKYIRQKWIHE